MRTSRAQFKYALRYAKSIEETARADSLASDFFDKNIDDFWSNVRRSTQSSTILSNCIDDVSGEVDISNFWKEHFERILNGGICNAQLKQSVVGKLQSIISVENRLVSTEEICNMLINSNVASLQVLATSVLNLSSFRTLGYIYYYYYVFHCISLYISCKNSWLSP